MRNEQVDRGRVRMTAGRAGRLCTSTKNNSVGVQNVFIAVRIWSSVADGSSLRSICTLPTLIHRTAPPEACRIRPKDRLACMFSKGDLSL